ncbi:MAG: SDR family oxidoreductase [Chloroflexi bacterium]|nr:SDR family oxidoreductase [Chloroflexota bacterium]
MRLEDQVAIVTGASRGIGEAIALAFAREGADLILAARTLADLERVAQKVEMLGRRAIVIETDITDETAVKQMIQRGHEALGKIDILVNNAGVTMFRPVRGIHLDIWERMMAVNLRGPFLCTKHVWRIMQKQGGGVIVNIGSTAGSRTYPHIGAYSASKWGLTGFTKVCAEEGKPDNIRVNIVNPGRVRTAMRDYHFVDDSAPILEADDIVGSVIFLASDDARYVYGQIIEIEHPGPPRK